MIPPRGARRRVLPLLGAAALAALLLSTAAPRALSGFAYFDDEGLHLATTTRLLAGARPYEDITFFYGPLDYAARALVHGVLGAPLTHEANRLVFLAAWTALAALLGAFTWRLTRSVWCAGLAGVLAFSDVHVLAREAGHPRDLLMLLGAGALLATCHVRRRASSSWPIAVLGAACAARALCKINSGAFLALALIPVFLACARLPAPRLARSASVVAAAILPAALMARSLMAGRHGALWAVSTLTVVTTVTALSATARSRPLRPGAVTPAVLAGGAVAVVILAATTLVGVSPEALLRGVVLDPARHGARFWWPLDVRLEVAVVPALLSLTGAALTVLTGQRAGVVAGLLTRGSGLVAFGVALWTWRDVRTSVLVGLPWAWLLLWPPGRRRLPFRAWLPRATLAALAALDLLVLYPVAGAQACEPHTWLGVVVAVALSDHVRHAHRALRRSDRRRLTIALVATGAALIAAPATLRPWTAWAAYRGLRPHGLSGATLIRAAPHEVALYTCLVENARANSDVFVGLPGAPSIELWSGRPVTSEFLLGAWPLYLSDDRQRRVVEELRRRERPLVLVDPRLLGFWLPDERARRVASQRPLMQHLRDDYEPWLRTPGPWLSVRRGADRSLLVPWLHAGPLDLGATEPRTVPWSLLLGAPDAPCTLSFVAEVTAPGVLVGDVPGALSSAEESRPIAYLGADGALRASLTGDAAHPLTSPGGLLGGGPHHVALTWSPGEQALWIDGRRVERGPAPARLAPLTVVLGGGAADGWPGAPRGWWPPRGRLRSVALHDRQLEPDEIASIASAALARRPDDATDR